MKKNMKKVLAAGLAATMVMGTTSVAMAAKAEKVSVDVDKVTFTKEYKTSEGETPATHPNETLTFVVTAASSNPNSNNGGQSIKIGNADESYATAENSFDVTGTTNTVTIYLPEYTQVGKYSYTVDENDVETKGVGYDAETFTVEVLAYHDPNNYSDIITDCAIKNATGKLDTITNVYELGDLEINKTVEGNLASQDNPFTMTVTFTSDHVVRSDISYNDPTDTPNGTVSYETDWTNNGSTWTATKTIYLKHNETVTFTNIPEGVDYKVVEDNEHFEDDATGNNPNTGYSVDYTNEEGTIGDAKSTATVKNTKGTEIATGISLDNMPYLMMLAMTVLGAFGFVSKKRKEEELF